MEAGLQMSGEVYVDWTTLTPISGAELRLFDRSWTCVLHGTIAVDPIATVRPAALAY
jgi:hypothetical protein